MSIQRLVSIALAILSLASDGRASLIAEDLKALFTADNLQIAAVGLGAAAATRAWDRDLEGKLRGDLLFARPSDLTDIYGASHFNLPASLAAWGIGRLARRQELANTGSALLRTLALTQLVVGPIKWAVRRDRPDRSSQLSFPSGHTANSFALARLLHRRYGHRVGAPLYVVGFFTGAGRIEGDKHYLSDVVMGAILGTLVGQAVTLAPDTRLSILPRLGADGPQLSLYLQF